MNLLVDESLKAKEIGPWQNNYIIKTLLLQGTNSDNIAAQLIVSFMVPCAILKGNVPLRKKQDDW